MTIIKVTCPTCGDLDLQPWQMVVRRVEQAYSYDYTCTHCEDDISTATDAATAARLQSAGVHLVTEFGPLTPQYLAAATQYLRENDFLAPDALTTEP